jgi:carbonic anhydrase/acetyltransferase-like protein (isoleucine patch superfamily)
MVASMHRSQPRIYPTLAASSLVPGGKRFPARSLLVGSPASRVRDMTDGEVERLIDRGVQTYLRLAAEYGGAETGESYPHRVTSPNEGSP